MKLDNAISQYIAYRRGLGELYESNGRMLKAFSRSLGPRTTLAGVRSEQVNRFLNGKGPVTSNWHAKHQALRGFYHYVTSRGYVSSSPLPKVIPKRPPPFVPYIYSHAELKALLCACLTYQKNRSRIDPQMMQTLLLLLYGTGLRVREAIRLTCSDVDFSSSYLIVRQTKFRKTRLVPFGAEVCEALKRYAGRQERGALPEQAQTPFFVSRDGRPLCRDTVEGVFARIREKAGVGRTDGARYQPRLHDLRHTFAVHRLIAWYRQGADVQTWLPVLSTYLGHTYLAATSVYLTMTPVLLDQANRRFQKYAFPESCHD
jgi:integrase/recombinase XerD